MATQPPKKRSLEDFLFQQPREEYVTAEPKKEFFDGRPVMKQEGDKHVFKGKTGTLTKDKSGKEVAEMAPLEDGYPVEEAQAPRLKDRILPPEEPMGEPPAMAQRYQEPQAAPKAEVPGPTGPNVWERLLIGATPALVGLLSGNELEGVSLSGQTLANTEADLYKRERDFNGKIAEMKAKRAISGTTSKKPNFARQELYDPRTGKTFVHSLVDNQDMGVLGEAPPNKVRESYSKVELYNPETKRMEMAFVNPKTKQVDFYGPGPQKDRTSLTDLDFQGESTKALIDMDTGDVKKYIGKTPEKKSAFADLEAGKNQRFKDQKLLDAYKAFTSRTSSFNQMKENLDGITMAAEQLNLGNPRANAGLQNFLARNVYGEKGPLSDGDISRLAGDPSYGALINRFLDARLNGTLGDMDRRDIRQILDLAHKTQVEKMMGEASRFGEGYKALGYDPTPGIQAYIKGAIRPIPNFVAGDITRKAMDHENKPSGPKAGDVVKGFKFKGGDPSKRENWEKQ